MTKPRLAPFLAPHQPPHVFVPSDQAGHTGRNGGAEDTAYPRGIGHACEHRAPTASETQVPWAGELGLSRPTLEFFAIGC
jgi:hypothetical protein